MNWRRMPLGYVQANAYIWKNEQGECLIFDPGGEAQKLISYVKEKQLKPLAVLLTHAHFDHIGAADEVREEWRVPLYVHENEKEWLTNAELNGSARLIGNGITVKEAEKLITSEGTLQIGSFTLEMFHTPGHSPGSVSYYSAEEGFVISGDTLFEGGIGRTDLVGGSQEVLLQSIHHKLLSLPESTLVLSGHGGETTVQTEQEQNPFINGFSL
ncbi:MBL fold metallo-hydrolase [Bacillus safensis]|uniref:MBL fold metallo-hydrolase n=1 Tax=Bacillus safensis TaxID=561879 RepID=UPI000F88F51C|nr:MBL fold metallo-hydrolase [Bacillus safensis]MBU5207131.1 MBL fold metallo-hydrolase [Bacillus safensis]MED1575660.1 MBL fold metallo-hydrolase [Bacillus safensis]RUK49251.1 MBL fold metallo-hydrolase [Bacillus safensis]